MCFGSLEKIIDLSSLRKTSPFFREGYFLAITRSPGFCTVLFSKTQPEDLSRKIFVSPQLSKCLRDSPVVRWKLLLVVMLVSPPFLLV